MQVRICEENVRWVEGCCRDAQMPPLKRCHMILGLLHGTVIFLRWQQLYPYFTLPLPPSPFWAHAPAVRLSRRTQHSLLPIYVTHQPIHPEPTPRPTLVTAQQTHTLRNNYKALTSSVVSTWLSHSQNHTYSANRPQIQSVTNLWPHFWYWNSALNPVCICRCNC